MGIDNRTRRLNWEGCRNARDLGGYRTTGGRETRWGAIVRSDAPSALTVTGQAALVAHGIRTIIDVRRPDEREHAPNPFASPGTHGILYQTRSFTDPGQRQPPTHYGAIPNDHTLADDYLDQLARFRARVAAIATAVARAPEGGVLIHCAAGKVAPASPARCRWAWSGWSARRSPPTTR